MNRKQVLETIKIEYAAHGKATAKAVRLWADNMISYAAFQGAAKRGMDIYMRTAPAVQQFDGVVKRAREA